MAQLRSVNENEPEGNHPYMKNIVLKLCERIKSEWPAFKRLTSLSTRLVMKKIDKGEVATARSELSSLFAQARSILCLSAGLLIVLSVVTSRGCGSSENDKPKKKAFSGDPNKVFSAYIKSRSVGYTFRMQIIDAFSRLSENDKKAVAAEMLAFMDR